MKLIHLLLALILWAGTGFAAGSSVSQPSCQNVKYGKGFKSEHMQVCTVSWVADDSDGSVPATSINLKGIVWKIVTNPGATAPTANYDITLVDGDGIDVLYGALANRHTSTSEVVQPAPATGGQWPPLLAGDVTFTLTNNSVNDALGTVVFYLVD